MAEERLQKILARAGIASRRKAEQLIQSGRVRVEGQIVTELGSKADTRAKIEVDGRKIERDQLCYGVLHKPRHMVTTLSDPEGRPTAQDILRQVGVRVIPVGRLDFNTSGALLFTNDGDFAQGLSHAKSGVPKVYVATVQGVPDERKLARWAESIEVDGKRTRPAEVRLIRREADKSWIEVTIREGKNRQVRRLAEHAQSSLIRLARISHAGIDTEGLKPGEWRLLTIDELKELKKTYGVPEKIRGVMEVLPERGAATRTRPQPRLSPARRDDGPRGRGPRPETMGSRGPGARSEGGRSFRAQAEREAPRGRGPRTEASAPRGRGPRTEAAAPRGRGPRTEASAPRGRGPRAEASAPRGRGARTEAAAPRGRGPRTEAAAPRGRSARAEGSPRAVSSRPRGSGSAPRPKKR